MNTYILNAAVITNYGIFRYTKIELEAVKELLLGDYINAIGHESTANLFSQITGINVIPNRIQVKMNKGDRAIVFWANQRLPEGVVIKSLVELRKIGFSFGLIEMLEEA